MKRKLGLKQKGINTYMRGIVLTLIALLFLSTNALSDTSSKFKHDYLELASGDAKMANIFADGEVEILNNPKVSKKRQERTVKRYVAALKEHLDNDGKGRTSTVDFLVKYTPKTVEKFKDLGGEFKLTYDIVKLDEIIDKLQSLQK